MLIRSMNQLQNKRGPSAPSGLPVLIRTYAYTIKRGMIKLIILLVLLSSCSSMKMSVNGIDVRKREPIRKEELRIYVCAFVGGYIVTRYYVER